VRVRPATRSSRRSRNGRKTPGLVLEGDRPPPPVVEGSGGGDRAGVGQVALAGAAGGQQPGAGGQLGRHVQDRLAGGDQQLGDPAAQAAGALHRPAPLRPGGRPGQPLGAGLAGGGQPLLAEQPAVGSRAAVRVRLWGSMPVVITAWPFVAAGTGSATGSLTSGGHTPLSRHVAAGAGRSPARYQRANPRWVARSLRARRPAPWTLRAADPGVLAAIQQLSARSPQTHRGRVRPPGRWVPPIPPQGGGGRHHHDTADAGTGHRRVDTHADVHVAVANDALGRWLDTIRVATTAAGYAELLGWAQPLGPVEGWAARAPAASGLDRTACFAVTARWWSRSTVPTGPPGAGAASPTRWTPRPPPEPSRLMRRHPQGR